MKKIIALVLCVAFALAGCATVSTTTTSNGTTCTAKYTAIFENFASINMSGCGSQGSATQATVDDNTFMTVMKAMTQAGASGAMAKPDKSDK